MSYEDGPIPIPIDDLFLAENVQHICVCDTGIKYSVALAFCLCSRKKQTNVYQAYFWVLMRCYIVSFVDVWVENRDILLFWQVKPVVHVFQVCFFSKAT